MASVITFTPQPVITSLPTSSPYTQVQDLTQALDVSGYDQLDLVLMIMSLSGGGVTVSLLTSLQNTYDDVSKSPSSWVSAGSFTKQSAVGSVVLSFPVTNSILLRYVRWQAAGDQSGVSATFTLSGMARRRFL